MSEVEVVFPLDKAVDILDDVVVVPLPFTRSGGSARSQSRSDVSGLAHSSSSVQACLGRKSSCRRLPSLSLSAPDDPQKLLLAATFFGSIVLE